MGYRNRTLTVGVVYYVFVNDVCQGYVLTISYKGRPYPFDHPLHLLLGPALLGLSGYGPQVVVVVVYYKDESECNAQMDAHAQRPRHQDNIQAQHQNHQTHRLRKSMGKESARGESRRDLSKAAAASKGAIG